METTPERKFHLQEFRAICHAISTYEDLNLLFDHMVEGVIRTFNVKGCCIMLFDEREKQLFHVASCGLSDEYLNKGPVIVDEKYDAFFKGEPVFIENMQNDYRVQYPESAAKESIVSMLSVPVQYRNQIIGIMRIYHDRKLKLHPDDIESFVVLNNQLGLVIQNNGLINFLNEVKFAMRNLPLRMLER